MKEPITRPESKIRSRPTNTEGVEETERILHSLIKLSEDLQTATTDEAAEVSETAWKSRAEVLATLRVLPHVIGSLRKTISVGFMKHIENLLRKIGVTVVGEIKHDDRITGQIRSRKE